VGRVARVGAGGGAGRSFGAGAPKWGCAWFFCPLTVRSYSRWVGRKARFCGCGPW